MSVGKAVLRIRQQKGLTQKDVGRKARLATSYISRIENDRIQPTMVTLRRLADALGVGAAEIFELSDAPRPVHVNRCPVSSSGSCIGELIRSHKGAPPKNSKGKATYGPQEIRLLRMADYVILHGSRSMRQALAVILESLVNQAGSEGRAPLPPQGLEDLEEKEPCGPECTHALQDPAHN